MRLFSKVHGMRKKIFLGGLLVVVSCFVLANCSVPNKPRFQPNGTKVYVPDSPVDFSEYINKNSNHIRASLGRRFENDAAPFGDDYSFDDVVNRISLPYELQPIEGSCPADEKPVGILIMHGLFGTPGSMRSLADSLHNAVPCSLIRATLMSGHGTVPADALETRYQEWQKMTAYAVHSFTGDVSDLFLVGFSTGAPLIIDYVQNPDRFNAFKSAPQISGSIFMAPAFSLPRYDHLASYLKKLTPYLMIGKDENPYRYESIPVNLGDQVVLLSEVPDYDQKISFPVMVVMSEDDNVIDFNGVRDYFCRSFTSPSKRMVIYPGVDSMVENCPGIDVHMPLSWPNQWRMVNFSHESLYHSADHPFFGFDAAHKDCRMYSWNPYAFKQCTTKIDKSVYGGYKLLYKRKARKGNRLRIGTFNPFYNEMINDFSSFINDHRAHSSNN